MLASEETNQIVVLFGAFVISTTCHEAAHALVAKLGGDDTAYRGGQVSLNPLPHIRREPLGMVLLPLVVLFSTHGRSILGWASAPLDPFWAERHPRRAALVSLAGPVANFLLAGLAFLTMFLLVRSSLDLREGTGLGISRIANAFLLVNVVLGIFNLIPLPPLDGAGVLQGLFPRTLGNFYAILRSQPFVMLALMYAFGTYGSRLYLPVFDYLQALAGK